MKAYFSNKHRKKPLGYNMQFMARYTIPIDKSRNLIAFIKMSKSM